MRYLLPWLALISCKNICDSRGYQIHSTVKNKCICSDVFDKDGSFEIPINATWAQKPESDYE